MLNYKFDLLQTVLNVLRNPPATGQKREWRLTPDTIREWMAIEIDRLAEVREAKWHNIKKDTGKISEEEMTPMSKETELLIADAIIRMKQPVGERKARLKIAFNIGEECPACKGIGCEYCDKKGAIGIVEIKAETKQDALKEYTERFGVKESTEKLSG